MEICDHLSFWTKHSDMKKLFLTQCSLRFCFKIILPIFRSQRRFTQQLKNAIFEFPSFGGVAKISKKFLTGGVILPPFQRHESPSPDRNGILFCCDWSEAEVVTKKI